MRIKLWHGRGRYALAGIGLAAGLLFLGGCTTINGFLNYSVKTATPSLAPTVAPSPTRTPTPNLTPDLTPSLVPSLTPSPTTAPQATPAYKIVAAQACPVATLPSLRALGPENSKVAWKPGSAALAYIVPLSDQLWYVGDLVVASGKAFSQTKTMTSGVQVAGDLFWSPDGTAIAFVAYRMEDAVYTVMVVRGTGTPVDLFPSQSAHTDAYSSPKHILQWLNADHLSVNAACGVDCDQMMDVNVTDGTLNPNGQPARQGTLTPAAIATEQRPYDPKLFPSMSDQVWSPDGSLIAYLDSAGNPWVLSVQGLTRYPLNVNNGQVEEMAWSSDGAWIAIRLDGSVEIFQLGCSM